MSCYFPLHAYKAKSKDSSKMSIVFRRPDSWRGVELDLPCGQCIGCRLERSRQWAVRCIHEASLYEENSFLTLTYDNVHLPSDGSLCLNDFQLFMKRLRKSIAPKRVRFYHCGEYGEQLGRPHYHALLFGYASPDRKFFSKRGAHPVYTSESMSRLWPQGFIVEGEVTFDSAAYVARYVMKKVTGSQSEAHYNGKKPEYTTMSRRPGIGAVWYSKYKSDVFPLDRIVVNGHISRVPRFYDSLLVKDDPSTMALVKIDRENNSLIGRFSRTVDGRIDEQACYRLAVKEVVKQAEVSQLIRPLEGVI